MDSVLEVKSCKDCKDLLAQRHGSSSSTVCKQTHLLVEIAQVLQMHNCMSGQETMLILLLLLMTTLLLLSLTKLRVMKDLILILLVLERFKKTEV